MVRHPMGRVGRIDAKNKKKTQTRAILHDDRLFPDPFTFKPERFTTPDMDPRVPAAVDYAFGFGRRVCPGRWMAHSFVWIVVASVLSTFRIEKAVRDGRVIEPTGAFTPGILACVVCLSYLMTSTEQGFFFLFASYRSPEKFECSVKPRSKEAEALVRATATA
jgi:hypothetical protein